MKTLIAILFFFCVSVVYSQEWIRFYTNPNGWQGANDYIGFKIVEPNKIISYVYDQISGLDIGDTVLNQPGGYYFEINPSTGETSKIFGPYDIQSFHYEFKDNKYYFYTEQYQIKLANDTLNSSYDTVPNSSSAFLICTDTSFNLLYSYEFKPDSMSCHDESPCVVNITRMKFDNSGDLTISFDGHPDGEGGGSAAVYFNQTTIGGDVIISFTDSLTELNDFGHLFSNHSLSVIDNRVIWEEAGAIRNNLNNDAKSIDGHLTRTSELVDGVFVLNDQMLEKYDINFNFIDEWLVKGEEINGLSQNSLGEVFMVKRKYMGNGYSGQIIYINENNEVLTYNLGIPINNDTSFFGATVHMYNDIYADSNYVYVSGEIATHQEVNMLDSTIPGDNLRRVFMAKIAITSINTPLEIDNVRYAKISVTPNPVTDILSISAEENEIADVHFFNSIGKEITISPMHRSRTQYKFSTSNLSSGLYYLRIQGPNWSAIEKIIIK